jgi:protein phosphatase
VSDASGASQPTPAAPLLRLRYAAVSDVGRYRSENQDSGYASPHLLVVADGVGGAAYGDVASATAVQVLRRLDEEPESGQMLTALAGAVHRVQDRLAELVEEDPELDGTSTTITAALFDGHRLGVAHIGDSRAYLLRDGTITRLTTDHTFVQTLVDDGQITEAEARVHPHRNIILRAVDGVHAADPDLFHVEPREGDRLLVCSDGCTGALTDEQVAALLGAGTVDAAAVHLVESALDQGSTDNVTVITAELVLADTTDDPESNAAASIGPMLVGAAAEQPRRGGMLSRSLRRHKRADTADLDAVDADAPGPRGAAGPEDPEHLRYAPRAPRRRAGLRRLVLVLVPLVLLALASGGAYAWSQRQYYVSEDEDYVAIFRGVQMDLPGVTLSQPIDRIEDLPMSRLTAFNQEKVRRGLVADDLPHARRIVADLEADACPVTPTEQPTEQPTGQPTGRPTGQPTDRPTERPTAPGTDRPTRQPSARATSAEGAATRTATASPTGSPTGSPTASPTGSPTGTVADPCAEVPAS